VEEIGGWHTYRHNESLTVHHFECPGDHAVAVSRASYNLPDGVDGIRREILGKRSECCNDRSSVVVFVVVFIVVFLMVFMGRR
jgi:hypothetical protein